ncbi:MAG: type II toxin-antitoxin system antitoxin DNA ADP-ribosyl glycohydrolase DarG [Terriglobales bacterium]
MIDFKTGDILSEDAEAVVNTVNCVGVMGRGIALKFKQAYPENFEAYALACRRQEVQPGRMFVFTPGQLTNPRYIINFPTKRHWHGKARIEDIEKGLVALVAEVSRRGIRSLAIPPLGAGLGGLDWAVVRPQIERALLALPDVRVVIFEPYATSPAESRARRSKVPPPMTPGRAALVGLMNRYLAGLLDPFVTLLEVHKLMYFMQESGERLRLKFVQGPYGPYAENLRHVLKAIEGHYISGYGDGGEGPDRALELVPGATDDAETALASSPLTKARFDRVEGLVQGFESPFGLELLATVHWVIAHGQPGPGNDLVARVYAWGERKRKFSSEQIRIAESALATKGWIAEAKPSQAPRPDPQGC